MTWIARKLSWRASSKRWGGCLGALGCSGDLLQRLERDASQLPQPACLASAMVTWDTLLHDSMGRAVTLQTLSTVTAGSGQACWPCAADNTHACHFCGAVGLWPVLDVCFCASFLLLMPPVPSCCWPPGVNWA
jgi:hypothetical protein